MNNQRGLAPIVIGLIIVVLLAGGILAWQYFGAPKEKVGAPETIDKCQYVQDLSKQAKCYTDLAKETKDEIYCGKIEIPEVPEVRSNCYIELAFLKNDPSICKKVETASLKSSCEKNFEEVVEEITTPRECAKEGEAKCDVMGCRVCCNGLVDHYITHPWRTENNEVVCLENMTAVICVKCGDGICGKGEDWCICPEDCPKPNPEDLELRNP